MLRAFQWDLARRFSLVVLIGVTWTGTASGVTTPPATTWREVVAATDPLSRIHAGTAFALNASAEQLAAALKNLDALPPETRERTARHLGQGLAQRHPEAALDILNSQPPGSRPELPSLRAGVFAGIGFSAPDLAIPLLTDFQQGKNRHLDDIEAFFEALSAHHPDRVEDLLDHCPAATRRLFLFQTAFRNNLLETNPALALTLALRHGPEENHRPETWSASMLPVSPLPGMIADWAKRDPASALAWTERYLEGATRQAIVGILLYHAGEQPEHLDFVRSIALSAEHPFRAEARSRYASILNRLPPDELWTHARRDNWAIFPQHGASSLAEHLANLPADEVRDALRASPPPATADATHIVPIIEAWAQVDPAAALAWSHDIDDETTRTRILSQLLPTLFETVPDLAASTYAALPADASRAQLSASIAVQFARADLEGGFAFANSLALPAERSRALEALGDFAAKHDPAPFAELLSRDFTSTSEDAAQARRFAAAWSRHDPGAALAWLRNQPRDTAYSWRYDGTLDRAARHAPDQLIALIHEQPHSPDRTAFIAGLARQQALHRPEDVAALIATLPTAHERAGLHAEVLRAIAKDDPAHAASLAASGTFGPTDIRQLNAIADVWSDRSATDAARWFDTLPLEYRTSGQVASRIASDFGRQNPEAAVAWIRTLPPNSRAHEIAVWNISAGLAEHYPTRAWEVALAAPDSVRAEQVTRTYRRLLHDNRALAERLINQADVPPELRDAVLAGSP